MFELFKLLWDFVVLRDASKKGYLNWRICLLAFGVVLVLYGTGVPVAMLYDKHPQYKPLFLATIIFDGLLLVCFLGWGWRRQLQQAAARKSATATKQPQ